MRKLFLAGAVLGLVVGINAVVDGRRTCPCLGTCWCKRPGLRHIRWWIPVGHDLPAET